MTWHVLISIDKPSDEDYNRMRRLWFKLEDHSKSFLHAPGGFKYSWPIQRMFGGEHHFILVFCEPEMVHELKVLSTKIMTGG